MNILLVASRSPVFDSYSYYQDWLNGFLNHPDHHTTLLDIHNRQFMPRSLSLAWRYDLIVFHHSLFIELVGSSKLPLLNTLLKRIRGKRVFFLSNEFRSLSTMCQMAQTLGADAIVSQLCQDDANLLYQQLWDKRILTLPYGFDPTNFQPNSPLAERPIHIGFRGDYYPAYVGHDDRDLLLEDLNQRVQDHPTIQADIRVGERFEQQGWATFLNQCRVLVGHEAGATRIDHDENIRHFINAQEKRLPKDAFRQLVIAMRNSGVFNPPPSGRIAAPRNFEAMGTKTAQVLLPGRYNDVLQKDVHYIELQRDFSNLGEVLERIQDTDALQTMVNRVYEEALAKHTYQKRVDELLHLMLG